MHFSAPPMGIARNDALLDAPVRQLVAPVLRDLRVVPGLWTEGWKCACE
jgi:hypothetical protein